MCVFRVSQDVDTVCANGLFEHTHTHTHTPEYIMHTHEQTVLHQACSWGGGVRTQPKRTILHFEMAISNYNYAVLAKVRESTHLHATVPYCVHNY